jgi:hypothetical protein
MWCLYPSGAGGFRLQITELICDVINSSIESIGGSFLCAPAGKYPDGQDERRQPDVVAGQRGIDPDSHRRGPSPPRGRGVTQYTYVAFD